MARLVFQVSQVSSVTKKAPFPRGLTRIGKGAEKGILDRNGEIGKTLRYPREKRKARGPKSTLFRPLDDHGPAAAVTPESDRAVLNETESGLPVVTADRFPAVSVGLKNYAVPEDKNLSSENGFHAAFRPRAETIV